MNHYTLAEMTPGLSESFTVTVTEEMMARFEAITGDVSPIHMDAEYAQKRGYPGRVVYGMLGASFSPPWRAFTCRANTACCTAWSASSPSRFSLGIL